MIGAVLRLHSDIEFAERSIDSLRGRLRSLTISPQAIDEPNARDLLDSAQRLALAVTARNAHLAAATAVLDGLRRREPPPAPALPAALAAGPAQPADLLRTR
ncbi:hypothetical protein [Actinacidiphila rubida]|uniref:Uncharacterized protein n=1 Tax=Actinacidiphila rubida TaxID=310780 RepID=A0A1H8S5J3_9ACTN|nr:hypothetical protein [Actinacidiphila rubida]SEO73882.1 hypothetical protein SAMN05216267_103960 [Actinacidiphila rubida]